MTDEQVGLYAEGMKVGTQMCIDLMLGENSAKALPDDTFDELKYDGPMTDEMREWLIARRENAADPHLQGDIEAGARLRRALEDWGR